MINEQATHKITHNIEDLESLRRTAWAALRDAEPNLVSVIEKLDSMIAGFTGDASDSPARTSASYSHIRSGVDALGCYLREFGPTPRLTAIHDVVRMGWDSGNPRAPKLLRDAINYQLKGNRDPVIVLSDDDVLSLVDQHLY